jgi:streptogramin lyase
MTTFTRMHARRTTALSFALTILSLAGCYKDLDVSKIACVASDKGSCPDGYQCSAGHCVRGQAGEDTASIEASPPSPRDATSADSADSAAVTSVDAAAADAQNITTTDAGAAEAAAVAAVDLGASPGMDASPDSPQIPPLDSGANDLPITGGVDASDGSATESGKVGIDAGVDAATHTIKEFWKQNLYSQPSGITAGPDGNLWFTEDDVGQIVQLSPTGVFTAFTIPTTLSVPTGITQGPDGNLWFTENWGNNIGCITPSGAITEFPIPTADASPWSITAGPDGNLWFTEAGANQIGRITPAGIITEYPIPTLDTSPSRIVKGPDGNLWFGESNTTNIGRITTTGKITEFAIPRVSDGLTVGPDNNLWYTTLYANMIGRMTLTGNNTDFPMPTSPTTHSGPYNIVAGKDGNLWFIERLWFGAFDVSNEPSKIGRMTLAGEVTEYTLSTPGVALDDIAVGPDGNLWFTEYNNGRIGRINP